MTEELFREWRKHASPVMVKWLANMDNRGRVRNVQDKVCKDLRNAILSLDNEDVQDAMLKDAHLSDVAILLNVPIASLDDKQRSYLSTLSSSYERSGRIQWFNPETDIEWEGWVKSGCTDTTSYVCANAR